MDGVGVGGSLDGLRLVLGLVLGLGRGLELVKYYSFVQCKYIYTNIPTQHIYTT